jgi:hypothetical protein
MLDRDEALVTNAVSNLSGAYGTDPLQTRRAVDSVVAALTTSMMTAASSRGGLADLVEIIGAPGRDAYLNPGTPLNDGDIRADGIGILSQLVGSPDKSRALAARASRASGLSQEAVKAMLPSIAAVAVSALSQRTQAAFGDILKIPGLDEIAREARDDIGGGGQLAPPQYGSPLPLPGEPPRRYSPKPNPDWTGSAGSAAPPAKPAAPPDGGIRKQSPLPIPGDDIPGMGRHEDNPYGDLSDILRRGGFRIPSGSGRRTGAPDAGGPVEAGGGGDLLSNIIRNILGSVFGNSGGRGSGLIGWIIRLIVLRYGASIVRSILRRFLRLNV